jgi:hypothetical protein
MADTTTAPAVAGTTTLTLPATTGTVLNDATVGVCRAWVNFNGTGTVAIRASFNVTSALRIMALVNTQLISRLRCQMQTIALFQSVHQTQ